MEKQLEIFLENFYIPCKSEYYQKDIEKIAKMTETERDDFEEKISYFMEDPQSYIREFAIDSITFENVVCNRCCNIHSIAKKELLAKICLSENLGINQKNERMSSFISGQALFDISDFKIPILRIISGDKTLIKDFILTAMESKRIIFIDSFGHLIT